MKAARAALVAPTIFAGLRLPVTTYVYDDPEHPERVTSTITSLAYTPEDRALLLGLQIFEDRFCDGCGHPKDRAWHSDMEGWFVRDAIVCHGCTAKAGGEERAIVRVRDTRPADDPVRPFVMWETTTPATDTDNGPSSPEPREESL